MRIHRNELLHDIIRRELPEKYIEDAIREIARSTDLVCTKSNLVRDYFTKSYGFDPAEFFRGIKPLE